MKIKSYLKNFDFLLLVILTIIFSLGMIAIASATDIKQNGITREFEMQLIAFFLGLIVIVFMLFIDYEVFGEFYWVIYGLSILLLLLVYIPGLGVNHFNARSWINLGRVDVQTSEIAKIGFIIFLAKFLEKNKGVKNLFDIFKCFLFLAPFLVLLMKQPDLGTALVFVLITIGMIFAAGIQYRYIFLGGIVAGVGLPLIYPKLKSHQKERIDAFLNPNDTSLPGNYQVLQSKITIGSGQMYGKGIFQGVYHKLNYLPVQESDFIFAVFVEETGFVGGSIVIALYALFLIRLILMSRKAKDDFGSYMIIGVVFMFAFQIIENIGMTMGIMPVTGITLPFFSYGATSIVTSMIAIGLVETILLRRKKSNFMY